MPTKKTPEKRECPVCHEMVAGGKGFGGHMSKHGKRRKNGSKSAQTAANSPRTPGRRPGRRIAPSTVSRSSRAGGVLPRPPARYGFPSSHVSALVRKIREAIARKFAQAEELQKMAVRLEQLL